jgi:hypothetical protein
MDRLPSTAGVSHFLLCVLFRIRLLDELTKSPRALITFFSMMHRRSVIQKHRERSHVVDEGDVI